MTDAAAVPGWRLRRRLTQLLAGFAVLVALLVAIVAVSGSRFVLTGNQVIYRWQPARLASQRLIGDLVNEETGVRGYVITGRSSSLQPYREYRPLERADAARLSTLIGDDPVLRTKLELVLIRADQWHDTYVRPVVARVKRGEAGTSVDSDAGRSLFDRIRAAAEPLDTSISARAADARHDRIVTGVVSVVAIAIGFLLIAAAGVFLRHGLRRWVLRPVGDLASQTRLVAAGGIERQIEPGGPLELVSLGEDVEAMRARLVTELARAESISADLRRQGAELERSNGDLAQFAYVASHDLSEPLRKVSNFCQLLERQYGPQLDDRARQYIDFAVDGAKRMQALINDLLALSRVGRTTDTFVPVELDDVLDRALATLAERINATGAVIERATPLPRVDGDRVLLTSLFENLVGNAIKYHRDDVAPVVTLSATPREETGGAWTIRVSDNGIGIEPQYADRIFAVFQRLHLRDQYGGTGIGLALCRRIVDFHGGRIDLDATSYDPAGGATFVITLLEGDPRAEQPS